MEFRGEHHGSVEIDHGASFEVNFEFLLLVWMVI